MPKYKLSKDRKKTTFEVADVFVDQYMADAPPVYVLVYLYGLRLCHGGGRPKTNADIARQLHILESDVEKAWAYWEEKKLVRLSGDADGAELVFAEPAAMESMRSATASGSPAYSPAELELYMKQNARVSELFAFAQDRLGMLSPGDLSLLYSFYDFYHLPFEVIFMMIEHYASEGKKNLRYMEKVAISWSEKGVDTVEKVEQQLCGKGLESRAAKPSDADRKAAAPRGKNKFVNFQQRDFDYNELARRMLQKRLDGESGEE